VANDEHGSLVVQCIFEHAHPHEKECILNEILDNVNVVAKGTFNFLDLFQDNGETMSFNGF
jgi:hypothetical protein